MNWDILLPRYAKAGTPHLCLYTWIPSQPPLAVSRQSGSPVMFRTRSALGTDRTTPKDVEQTETSMDERPESIAPRSALCLPRWWPFAASDWFTVGSRNLIRIVGAFPFKQVEFG